MRLCLFTPTFLPRIGGTEVVIDALAREFHASGNHVTVLAKRDKRLNGVQLDVPYHVRWFDQPISHRLFPERIERHLRAAHERERFDVIVAYYGQPTGYTAVRFGEKTGVPVVLISQGGDLYRSSKHRNRPHLWKRKL